MNIRTTEGKRRRWICAIVWAGLAPTGLSDGGWTALEYAPAPPDNPLKGFAPYAGEARDFPHSLEFSYVPLRAIMTGLDQFNWAPIESLLSQTSSRGCQAVFRIYLEYPGRESGIPQFLLDAGLRTYTRAHSDGKRVVIPDYTDWRLRAALTNAIHALGERYDNDARVAFLTAGFLGTWGEWHTWPWDELWAPKETQREVMDAFEAAFRNTPVLLRYPAGDSDSEYAANHGRKFGYHDDSFAWATIETGRPADAWFFMALMRRAGPDAMEKWRTCPIGGEIRPEVWPTIWNDPPGTPPGQDYNLCVDVTHATWLMDSSIARALTPEQRARAIEGARRLGYEFHVAQARRSAAPGGRCRVEVEIRNRGVAPFYANWPVELAALDSNGQPLATWPSEWRLRGLQPDEPGRRFAFVTPSALPAGAATLAMRVPNPMPGGRPLRFANRSQDPGPAGWLVLGSVPSADGSPRIVKIGQPVDTISMTLTDLFIGMTTEVQRSTALQRLTWTNTAVFVAEDIHTNINASATDEVQFYRFRQR